MTGKVSSSNLKNAGIDLRRNDYCSWGDSLSLKLNEQGKNSPDTMDQSETLPTSQIQSHPLVGKNNRLDVPVLRTSGAFSIPPGNEMASKNQGLLTPELIYNFHLSMMQKISREETASSSHNNPNTMDAIKTNQEMRLIFDRDLFTGGGEFQEQRTYLRGIFTLIPKPSEGNFMLSAEELKVASMKLKHSHQNLKSKLIKKHMIKIKEYKAIWYKYWKEEQKIVFSKLENYQVMNFDFEDIFDVYFILVTEILIILPFKENQPLDQKLDYAQEMRKALASYLDFVKIIEEHRWDESGPFVELIGSILNSAGRPSQKSGAIIWKFIEFWMEKYYNGVWIFLREYQKKCIANNVKSFFNGVYIYGIENMTRNIALK
jgi:hypothetical protein